MIYFLLFLFDYRGYFYNSILLASTFVILHEIFLRSVFLLATTVFATLSLNGNVRVWIELGAFTLGISSRALFGAELRSGMRCL